MRRSGWGTRGHDVEGRDLSKTFATVIVGVVNGQDWVGYGPVSLQSVFNADFLKDHLRKKRGRCPLQFSGGSSLKTWYILHLKCTLSMYHRYGVLFECMMSRTFRVKPPQNLSGHRPHLSGTWTFNWLANLTEVMWHHSYCWKWCWLSVVGHHYYLSNFVAFFVSIMFLTRGILVKKISRTAFKNSYCVVLLTFIDKGFILIIIIRINCYAEFLFFPFSFLCWRWTKSVCFVNNFYFSVQMGMHLVLLVANRWRTSIKLCLN